MDLLAAKIKTASTPERAKMIEGFTKKQLEKLCKALGISSDGHVIYLKNTIIQTKFK